ncbi:hypothetical protein LIER_16722 [Lithospermum erythrorhizon]|uniref:Uncharacterized protein n=1 Tax=Lithospermum erythrorhizon TaxID=34254 RepID=A0AAV3Q7Q8_LITER
MVMFWNLAVILKFIACSFIEERGTTVSSHHLQSFIPLTRNLLPQKFSNLFCSRIQISQNYPSKSTSLFPSKMARTKGGNVRRASSALLIGENEKGEPVPLQTIPAQSLPREPPTKSEDLGLPWKDDKLKGDTSSKPRSADHDVSASPTNVKTGGRIKRVLRKSKPPTRHVPHPVKPTVSDEESKKNVYDDVVIVSETASRRRTRASTAALKTKRESAGLDDEQDKSDDSGNLKESKGERKAKEK